MQVDLALEMQSSGDEASRARTVREVSSLVVPALFRVLDFDESGDIGTHEFIRGALLLLATVQGAPLDTPQLAELCFRVVDADGDGLVTREDLGRWVRRGVEQGVIGAERLVVAWGPWGLLGTRVLSPQQLADRWLREADLDQDGHLRPEEFQLLCPRLRIHRVIHGWAERFV